MKNLPELFVESLKQLNHPAYDGLPQVIAEGVSPVSVRINPAKSHSAAAPFSESTPIQWCRGGFWLDTRPQFTLDVRLHQGIYYVQDASSMAIGNAVERAVELLEQKDDRPLAYLDACAAPGGKTTLAIDRLPEESFVVANDYDSRRAAVLAENLMKWGTEAYVTSGDASRLQFPTAFFDIISADVPCSGEGMMRKEARAIEQWSPSLVAQCSALQLSIVDNLWKALRPGGFMVYSTCTYNLEENELIVKHLVDSHNAEVIEIPSLHSTGAIGSRGGHDFPVYRFVPGLVRGEGQFLALLRKPIDTSAAYRFRQPKAKTSTSRQPLIPNDIVGGDYTPVASDTPRLVAAKHLPLYNAMLKAVRPLVAGIEPGTIKGRDFVPSQQLALHRRINRERFTEVEILKDDALNYLRREAISLPGHAPKGIVLLTYENTPLGFVKNLGQRANNLYPESWRIRTL